MDVNPDFQCELTSFQNSAIQGMTFDGCSYYFFSDCEIVKTDMEIHILARFSTNRAYEHICYDWSEQCFWASTLQKYHTLYKLDCQFNELTCITLTGLPERSGPVTGISYECCNDKLLVAFEKMVVRAKKNGECNRCMNMPYVQITGILSLCPGGIISVMKGMQQQLYLWPPEGCLTEIHYSRPDCRILSIIFNPCCQSGDSLDFLILSDENVLYLQRIPLCECELRYTPLKCNYDICDSCCEKPEPKPVNCNDIIESIALEEAALAHILNAEGEKIQKILAITDDFDKIMCVNQEVNKTIINVTILEQTLYAKLMAITQRCPCEINCDFCGDSNCDCL